MTVASIDLCKTLFSDSGWIGTTLNHFRFHNGKETIEPRPISDYISARGIPAYDLGYLLRKLPPSTAIRKRPTNGVTKEYSAFAAVRSGVVAVDSTPEDAAARLAIQLFEHAVLRKAGDGA